MVLTGVFEVFNRGGETDTQGAVKELVARLGGEIKSDANRLTDVLVYGLARSPRAHLWSCREWRDTAGSSYFESYVGSESWWERERFLVRAQGEKGLGGRRDGKGESPTTSQKYRDALKQNERGAAYPSQFSPLN